MPRVIRISCCYNCPYRDHFIYNGDAVWVCNHFEKDGEQIGSAIVEPPDWCPLDKEG